MCSVRPASHRCRRRWSRRTSAHRGSRQPRSSTTGRRSQRCSRGVPNNRHDMLGERLEECSLGLADVVDPESVETQCGEFAESVTVPRRVGRDQHRAANVVWPYERGGGVEVGRLVEVPAQGRTEHIGAPLIMGDRQRLLLRRGPGTCTWRYAGLPTPPPSRNAPITRSSAEGSWLTVTRPSAQPPTKAAVSAVTAAPISGGGVSGNVHNRARSTSINP